MKSKRNILIFVLMLTVAFVLSACSTSRSDSSESSPVSSSAESVREAAADRGEVEASSVPSDPEQTDGTVLVAYFSHTGNTEEVAGQIAGLTGGTLAEIQRAEEYEDLQEEAEHEILGGVHPEITVSADNVEDYGIILYP